MRPLAPAGGSRFLTKVKKAVQKKKQCKRGLACAFTPGLLKSNNGDDSTREVVLNIYRETLKKCGFITGSNRNRDPSTWKVTLSPTASYEVQLFLDEDMNVKNIHERNLNWLHCTILSKQQEFFGNICHNADIRFEISSTDPVKEGSNLFRTVLPDINGKRILPIKLSHDGRPVLSTVGSKRAKDIVNVVRHIQRLEMFTTGSMDASITYGNFYSGENLVLNRPFCDLSLYFNPEKLQGAISTFVDKEKLEIYVRECFDTALLVGETLESQTAVFAANTKQ